MGADWSQGWHSSSLLGGTGRFRALKVSRLSLPLRWSPCPPIQRAHTLWCGPTSLVRVPRVRTQCRHSWPHLVRGDVWVIFLSESSPAQSPCNLCYTREFCLFWRLGPHTGLKQVQRNICHCTKTCLLFCSLRRTAPSLFFTPLHVLPQLPTSFVDKSLCGNWLVSQNWSNGLTFFRKYLGKAELPHLWSPFSFPRLSFSRIFPWRWLGSRYWGEYSSGSWSPGPSNGS